MKELSRIALAIEPSATMAIDTMFKQMKADGLDVIGFGAVSLISPPPTILRRLVSRPSRITTPSIRLLWVLWLCARPSASV